MTSRGFVMEHLGDAGAVLVVDETEDVKKGTATPGVQRQYTGTAGRIENAQVAVYLGYAAPRGHALIDRELYLPKSWAGDPGRCRGAGIPADTFATKPQLARRMIERAVTAAVPFSWVAGDEVYGDNGPLRGWLEEQDIAYVLAVACHHRVPGRAGRALRADELAARLPGKAWQRLPAGEGAKGQRWYDWAWAAISDPGPGCRHLLIRRNRAAGNAGLLPLTAPGQSLAAHRHGRGAAVDSRGELPGRQGPDRPGRAPGPAMGLPVSRGSPSPCSLVSSPSQPPSSTPAVLVGRPDPADQERDRPPARRHHYPRVMRHRSRMRWSTWRRRHQYRARACHYKRQAAQDQGA